MILSPCSTNATANGAVAAEAPVITALTAIVDVNS